MHSFLIANGLVILFAGVVQGAVFAASTIPGSQIPESQGELTAGKTTVYATGQNAFSFPFANLSQPERTRFAIGNSFFKRNWVQAPASTSARDGLGPHFIARSCGACHAFDGRGKPPQQVDGISTEQAVDLLFRLSIEPNTLTDMQHQLRARYGVIPEPVYGDQLNNAAIDGVQAEAQVVVQTVPLLGKYPDGTPYELLAPTYSFKQFAYGPLHPDVKVSPRIAPQLIGVGLIDAISPQDLLDNAAQQMQAQSSIHGRVNRVHDPFLGDNVIGRFGWKANVASLAGQTALAFRGDIGITSSKVPHESCTAAQTDCLKAPSGAELGGHEITDSLLEQVIFYQSVLAPPARRNVNNPAVQRGEQLFHQADCAVCHHPSYVTVESQWPSAASENAQGVRIWPYTDLLLHDMGEDLADHRVDGLAHGREWKTPPLWGIGLIQAVNGHSHLLHDGRARNIEEAILWHGGEAEQSKQFFKALTQSERVALIQFVQSEGVQKSVSRS